VTIGEASAGAASVDLHLSAYGGRDDCLFHATAAQSQSFGVQFTIEGSQYQYNALIARTGCNETSDSLACLRKLPIATLQGSNINIPTPGGGSARHCICILMSLMEASRRISHIISTARANSSKFLWSLGALLPTLESQRFSINTTKGRLKRRDRFCPQKHRQHHSHEQFPQKPAPTPNQCPTFPNRYVISQS
jgi:hypothetical protein